MPDIKIACFITKICRAYRLEILWSFRFVYRCCISGVLACSSGKRRRWHDWRFADIIPADAVDILLIDIVREQGWNYHVHLHLIMVKYL
ncbi:hypothetical protein D3C86_1786460 [compost metagenome]